MHTYVKNLLKEHHIDRYRTVLKKKSCVLYTVLVNMRVSVHLCVQATTEFIFGLCVLLDSYSGYFKIVDLATLPLT